MPYERPRLASIETKVVDEFENMSDEELRKIVEAAARGEEPMLPTPRPGGSGKPKLVSSR